jgi:hypothetical protein
MEQCPQAISEHVPQLVEEAVAPMLSDEAPNVVDNACGALARALATHRGLLPVESILQVQSSCSSSVTNLFLVLAERLML